MCWLVDLIGLLLVGSHSVVSLYNRSMPSQVCITSVAMRKGFGSVVQGPITANSPGRYNDVTRVGYYPGLPRQCGELSICDSLHKRPHWEALYKYCILRILS